MYIFISWIKRILILTNIIDLESVTSPSSFGSITVKTGGESAIANNTVLSLVHATTVLFLYYIMRKY